MSFLSSQVCGWFSCRCAGRALPSFKAVLVHHELLLLLVNTGRGSDKRLVLPFILAQYLFLVPQYVGKTDSLKNIFWTPYTGFFVVVVLQTLCLVWCPSLYNLLEFSTVLQRPAGNRTSDSLMPNARRTDGRLYQVPAPPNSVRGCGQRQCILSRRKHTVLLGSNPHHGRLTRIPANTFTSSPESQQWLSCPKVNLC